MAFRVKTDSFEGPFDLLLYLVGKQRVDIGAISITSVVDQYLAEVACMRKLDLDVASDFLLVASTLLEIKASSLVPREPASPEDDEMAEMTPREARDILVGRLLTYKQFKNAAMGLGALYERRGSMFARTFGPDADLRSVMPDFLRDVSLDGLAYRAACCYARREVFLLESEHIASKPIPVEVQVRALHRRIANRKSLRFSQLVDPASPVPVVVVTFLAILELFKRSMVDLVQDEEFGDIRIDYIEGSGDLVFEGESERLTSFEEDFNVR
ncbi:ScpA family protein [Gordonibacter sp. Marseille-P4307]|uniref:segregation and condensation protein A n=1 Tax=Gordonibacter sp. Marseille-P4307 TaxID=2161815 RepID=UPI000F538D6D|nr:segregation/condensation protein A [Gordonibacter sp. Marseille-P4307]